jgi:GDP-L-fucose synthase
MIPSDKIYVAGHRGMVGSAICRALKKSGFNNLLTVTSDKLDLRDQAAVQDFFREEVPRYVFLAAARVGGIYANDTYRAEFLYDNVSIQNNVIHASYLNGVKKLLFLGSSCVYPKEAPQPIREEYLLSGSLESTNEAYAIAKIAGIKLCEAYRHQYGANFISVMPCNLYGVGDNYHPENSHVLPALIRKFHEAKICGQAEIQVWGSGRPKREFLYADDLADACVFLMQQYDDAMPINVGTGDDLSIFALAGLIKKITGFEGNIVFDPSKPDGTMRKVLDVSRIQRMGWKHSTSLLQGLEKAYKDFLQIEPQLTLK